MTEVTQRIQFKQMKKQEDLKVYYEQIYKDKVLQMNKFYEQKHQSLLEAIAKVYQRVTHDELLQTMSADKVSSVYKDERIREIFGDIVGNQREIVIEKLGAQLIELKFTNNEIEKKYEKLREETQGLEKNCFTQRLANQQLKNSSKEELSNLKQQIYTLKLELKSSQAVITEQKALIQKLGDQNEELEQELKNIGGKMSEAIEDSNVKFTNKNSQLLEHREIVRELQNKLREAEEHFRSLHQLEEGKNRRKIHQYKQKIQEYKKVAVALKDQLNQQATSQHQKARVADLERRISQLVCEHQRKINELKTGKERDRVQVQRRCESRVREMQNYYERLFEQRITEVEESTTRYMDKMKEQEAALRKQFSMYQSEYIPLAEHEDFVGERDQVIALMKTKMEELQELSIHQQRKCQDYQSKLEECMGKLTEAKKHGNMGDEVQNEMRSKIKMYQQTINALKIQDKKSKAQLEQSDKIIRRDQEANESLRKQLDSQSVELKSTSSAIRDREQAIRELTDERDLTEKKLKRLTESLELINKEKEGLIEASLTLKKEFTTMEYRLKEQEHANSLTISNNQYKQGMLLSQVREKNERIKEWQDKHAVLNQELLISHRKICEIESAMKRQELQCSLLKEGADLFKNEHANTVAQLRRSLADKTEQLLEWQRNIESMNSKRGKWDEERDRSAKQHESENGRLRKVLHRLNHLLTQKIAHLKRELDGMREWVTTRGVISHNEEAVLQSTISRHFSEFHSKMQEAREVSIKRVKEESENKLIIELRTLKNDQDREMQIIHQKNQNEKQQIRKDLKNSEEKIDNISRENRKIAHQMTKLTQEKNQAEKSKIAAENKIVKERESQEQKYCDFVKECKDERESIIRDYEQKREQMETQIGQQLKALKKLKVETEVIESRHEEEKLQIHAQLRTIREQQEAIQKIVIKKDQQIQQILSEKQQLLEKVHQAENRLRQLQDTLSRKGEALQQLQLKETQLNGNFSVLKSQSDRIQEENQEIKRQLKGKQLELEQAIRSKTRVESELRDIRGAINRSNKNQQLRALSSLSMETVELSQKVNEMKRMSLFSEGKTHLRS